MFQVKQMRPEDFSFATDLANTMDWNMAPEDFQFMSQLEPESCFVLFDDLKKVGIATCINYGAVGWFGNLVVKQEYRGRIRFESTFISAPKYITNQSSRL